MDTDKNKRKEEEVVEMKMGGIVTTNKKTTIADGKKMYQIDSDRKEAIYMDMPFSVAGDEPTYDSKYLKGENEVAGKKCQLYDLGEIKMCIWNALTLKEEMNQGGMYRLVEAVKIDEDVVFDAGLFELPSDIKIKSAQESLADSMKSLADSMAVKKDAPITMMETGRAFIGDEQARKKMETTIQNDPKLSQKEKQDTLKGMNVFFSEQDKVLAPARRDDGTMDMDKALPLLTAERIKADDNLAKSTLRNLSTACETYAATNQNKYPETMESLIKAEPPYITRNYCNQSVAGFTYTCQLNAAGYTFTASPVRLGETGSTTFTIATGGVIR
jgi:hypothetical protein